MASKSDGLESSVYGQKPVKRRIWPWVVLTVLIAMVGALPSVIRLSLIEFLPRLGFNTVEVGDVDFNPLLGTFAIHELKLTRDGKTVLSGRQVEVDLAMTALFDRQIDLEVLRIKGVMLTVATEPGAAIEIAGIALPADDGSKAQPEPESGPAWGIGWQGIVVEDLTVRHRQQGVNTDLTIASAYLDRAASWQPDTDSHLQLSGKIDQAGYDLHASLKPFSPALEVDAGLRLDGLDGGHFATLAPKEFKDLAGLLSIAGQLRLRLGDKGPSVAYEGGAGLKQFGIAYGGYILKNDALDLKGRFDLVPSDSGGAISWSGDLALSGVGIKTTAGPLLDIPKLTVADASQKPSGEISIDRIAIHGPHAVISVDANGRLNLPESANPEVQSVGKSTPAQTNKAERPAPRIHIGGVELTDSRIDIDDRSVNPAFRSKISIDRLALAAVDSGLPDKASDWSLKARIGEFSRLDVHGKVKPFSDLPDANVSGTLRGLPLQTLSGYSAMSIGYFIDSGQADADIDVAAVKGELSGKIGMRLARLEVSPAEQERIDQLTAQLSMPLPSALSILKNDDGEITLSLPLSGNTAAPDFGVAPLINKLLGIALKKAAVGYLSNLLQPYATIFTLGQLAFDAASKISLDPLVFVDGQGQIVADSAPYVGKLGKLLAERPELTLSVCGFATTGDAEALAAAAKEKEEQSGKSSKKEPVPEETAAPEISEDALHELAAARAEQVKHVLVEQYKIDQGRLFLCRPQVDTDPKGRPRVELSI